MKFMIKKPPRQKALGKTIPKLSKLVLLWSHNSFQGGLAEKSTLKMTLIN